MNEQAVRGNGAVLGFDDSSEKRAELPVGSELMISFALGAAGWYVIVRLIQWVAS